MTVATMLLTVCEKAGLASLLKFVSPAYVAVIDFVPELEKLVEHDPAAAVPVHNVVAPSLTVTFPVGPIGPDGDTATE